MPIAVFPIWWGLLEGANAYLQRFFKELPLKQKIKELARYIGVDAIPLGCRAFKSGNKGIYLASNPQTRKRLKFWAGIDAKQSPMISIKEKEILEAPPLPDDPPHLLYAGRLLSWKGSHILLKAMSLLWSEGVKVPLRIIGMGSEQDQRDLERHIKTVGLPPEAVETFPGMPRDEFMKHLPRAKAFIYPAFRDSGAMVLLEALAAGATPLCFDIPSQDWLPNDLAIKVPVRCGHTEYDLSMGIKRALEQKRKTESNDYRCRFLKENMTWKARIDMFETFYMQLAGTTKV